MRIAVVLAVATAALALAGGATPAPGARVEYAVSLRATVASVADINHYIVDAGCRIHLTGGGWRELQVRTARPGRLFVRGGSIVRGVLAAVARRKIGYRTGYWIPECEGRPTVHGDPPPPQTTSAGRFAVRYAGGGEGQLRLSTGGAAPLLQPFEACGRPIAVAGLEVAPGRLPAARLRRGDRRVIASGSIERITQPEDAEGCTLTLRVAWRLVFTRAPLRR